MESPEKLKLTQNIWEESPATELLIANNELVFQSKERDKRAAELLIANKELAFQNEEKEKRAAEMIVINKNLIEAQARIIQLNDELEKKYLTAPHSWNLPTKNWRRSHIPSPMTCVRRFWQS